MNVFIWQPRELCRETNYSKHNTAPDGTDSERLFTHFLHSASARNSLEMSADRFISPVARERVAPGHKGRAGLFIWTLPGRGVRSIAKGQTDANGSQEAIRID